nr:condensation domain-containing protein [Gordonia humi]
MAERGIAAGGGADGAEPAGQAVGGDAERRPDEPSAESGSAPLSPSEERMWMLHHRHESGNTGAGVLVAALTLRGSLDVERLRSALAQTIDEFPSLRTTYAFAADGTLTPVEREVDGRPRVETVSSRDHAARRAMELAAAPFDLAVDTALRVTIETVAPDDHVMIVVGHHIGLDDASWGPVMSRVSELYREPSAAPPAIADYREYARRCDQRGAHEDDLEYWASVFDAPFVPVPLPTRWRPGPVVAEPVGLASVDTTDSVYGRAPGAGRYRVELPIAADYAECARSLGASVFHMHVALTSALLAAVTGHHDLTVATPVVDVDPTQPGALVGATGNLMPIRVRVDPEGDFADHVDTVRDSIMDGLAHSQVPIEQVISRIGGSGTKPFNVMVVQAGDPAEHLRLDDVEVTSIPLPALGADADLIVVLLPSAERLALEVTHGPAVSGGAAHLLLEQLAAATQTLLGEPDASLTELVGSFHTDDPTTAEPVTESRGRPSGTADEALIESILAEFRTALDADRLTADDDFFEAGGHSLMATRIVGRLRTSGHTVRLQDVFEAPTARRLAAVLGHSDDAEATVGASAPAPESDSAATDSLDADSSAAVSAGPLSSAQQRLWFLDRLAGPSSTYNVPYTFDLEGPLDVGAVETALLDLVKRHDVLRSVVEETDGVPSRRVLSMDEVRAGVGGPLFTGPIEATGQEVSRRCDAAGARPFDLAADLPLRATLLRTAPDRHVLSLVVHHLASDEWSTGILVHDLEQAYSARRNGEAPRWEPVASYAEYAEQERSGAVTHDGSAWWAQRLAGLDDTGPMLVDPQTDLDPVDAADGGWYEFDIAPELTEGLRDLARVAGASDFMTVTAAVAVLAHRLGEGTDICLGTPVAGRDDPRFADTMGMFANTVPLRMDLSGDPAVVDVVRQARTVVLEATEHADVPFERIVDAASTDRGGSASPLFSTLVQLHSTDDMTAHWGTGEHTVTLTPRPIPRDTAKFDLTFEFFDEGRATGEPMRCGISFRTALYRRTDVVRIAEWLQTVLTAFAAAAELSQERVGQIRLAENPVPHETDADRSGRPETVPEFLAAAREGTMAAPAVIGDRFLTHADLWAEAGAIVERLAGAGVGPGDVVGVALPRGADAVVAIVAVAATGAAIAPIDPGPSGSLIARAIGRLSALIVDDRPPEVVDAPTAIAMTDVRGAAPNEWPALATVRPEDAAYRIQTSGSSGEPKSVIGTQRGLAHRLSWRRDEIESSTAESGAWLLLSAPTFIDGITTVLGAVGSGRPLAVATDDELADLDRLVELVRRARPSSATTVPSMLTAIVAERPDLVGSIGEWVCSGEKLPPALARSVADAGGSTLVDSYGCTECAGDDVRGVVSGDGAGVGGSVPGMTARLLDEYLHPVPDGCVGDLYTAGPQMARGYHAAPGATAVRFVADPSDPDGGLMYRTGDRARRVDHGRIEIVGRADRQIKIRGIRVDPATAEWALESVPGVNEAAVVAAIDDGRGRLDGYLVVDADAEAAVDGETLDDRIRRLVPAHLVPSTLTRIDEVPRTHSGKTDYRSLPAPAVQERSEEPPATETEQAVARAYADLLGVDRVFRDDGFFHLGGDSISSIALGSRLSRQGFVTSPRTVFDHPTVRALAAELDRMTADAPASAEPVDDGSAMSAAGLDDAALAALLGRFDGELG